MPSRSSGSSTSWTPRRPWTLLLSSTLKRLARPTPLQQDLVLYEGRHRAEPLDAHDEDPNARRFQNRPPRHDVLAPTAAAVHAALTRTWRRGASQSRRLRRCRRGWPSSFECGRQLRPLMRVHDCATASGTHGRRRTFQCRLRALLDRFITCRSVIPPSTTKARRSASVG